MTEVYLIRHSEPMRDGIEFYKMSQYQQESNEKRILSINGERKAKILSEYSELKNIDYIFSSNYVRAISTAKYIASSNNKNIMIDEQFGERLFGIKDWSELPEGFERKQLEDFDYKLPNGESFNEVKKRMKEALDDKLNKYSGSRIVIVSHATALTCLLLNYTTLDFENKKMLFNNEEFFDFKWDSPELFKLTFDEKKLVSIKNIKIDYV